MLAKLQGPTAAMRSPILIEPMHSFSYGHHRQRHMARGRLRTYDDDDDGVAQDGAHLINLCMQPGLHAYACSLGYMQLPYLRPIL